MMLCLFEYCFSILIVSRILKVKVLGRPRLPECQVGRPRTVRLNDDRWEKLKLLGRSWLEEAIDKSSFKGK